MLLLAATPLLAWWLYRNLPGLDGRPTPQVPEIGADPLHQEHLKKIVEEALVTQQDWNQQAAERCVDRIRDQFRLYRKGVPSFAEDVTSIRTRFGVLIRMPGDWWYADDSVEKFVTQRFEEHFFDEASLQSHIVGSLTQFRDDIHSNQSALLTSIKMKIEEASLPNVTLPESLEFDREVQRALVALSTERAEDSVYAGITSLLVSELGASLATGLVARLVSSMSATTVASVATSGGATAGAATTGAGGGTAAGPIGTVIGLGVGLAVGVAIDWWMTHEFQQQLQMEMEGYLFQVEGQIIRGDATHPGLELALEQIVTDLHTIHTQVFDQVALRPN